MNGEQNHVPDLIPDLNQETIAGKLEQKIRQAYEAGTPLIMIATNELELVKSVAVRSGTVDLLQKVRDADADVWMPYYAFLGIDEHEPAYADNYSTDFLDLRALLADNTKKPHLFVLHLFPESRKNTVEQKIEMIECLREYIEAALNCRIPVHPVKTSCVILYGDPADLPQDLMIYTEILEVPFPKMKEIREMIREMALQNGTPFTIEDDIKEISAQLAGFELMNARRVINRLMMLTDASGKALLFCPKERQEIIEQAKRQFLLQSGDLLELCKPEQSACENRLGGMRIFTEWVKQNRTRAREAEKFRLHRGIGRLKGVLICGVPGCGKSEAAFILQQAWDLPMLRMSVDRLMGSYVGDSERNMRMALRQAEAMAPCILWIDEIDKGFSASGRGSTDNGVFKRMFGYFLTWMQTNKKPCFIFATANDIGQLPPELFRSGRFDVLYSVYMPTAAECIDIFHEQMKRLERRSREEAEQWGLSAHPLFESGCTEPKYLEKLMELFLDPMVLDVCGRVKFVTGADIEKIVSVSMAGIGNSHWEKSEQTPETAEMTEIGLDSPVSPQEWLSAVRKTLCDPGIGTFGYSPSNLDIITACVVRLLRGNFVPAGEQLLDPGSYECVFHPETGKMEARYIDRETEKQSHPYDAALRREILSRFDRIATLVENSELQKTLL